MATQESTERTPTLRNIWRLFLMVIGIIAVVQELRKPADERTWEGKVGNFVPYDFRKPTMERFREAYWNEDGPILSRRVWGVGWAPNFGAVKRLLASKPYSESGATPNDSATN